MKLVALLALMSCETATDAVEEPEVEGETSFDVALSLDARMDGGKADVLSLSDAAAADGDLARDAVHPTDIFESDASVDGRDATAELDAAAVAFDQGEPSDGASVDGVQTAKPDGGTVDVATHDLEGAADLGIPDAVDELALPDLALVRDALVTPDAGLTPDARMISDAGRLPPNPVVCREEIVPLPPCNGCPAGTEVPSGWVCIPAGEFWMGLEIDRGNGHLVRVTRPFLIMETEVTVGEWLSAEFRGRSFVHPLVNEECPECEFSLDVPVDGATWSEALGFANSRSLASDLPACYELLGCTGQPPGYEEFADIDNGELVPWCQGVRHQQEISDCEGFRLPTEAEWELAARAGVDGARYGDLDDIAWHVSVSGPAIHPVGLKRANAFGLHDVLGNVEELVWDEFDTDYWGVGDRGSIEPQDVDPQTRPFDRAVVKGGSVLSRVPALGVRGPSSNRFRSHLTGFRLARSLPLPPCGCPAADAPVCGVNGVTYQSDCLVDCAAVQIAHEGECRQDCLDPEAIDVEYLSADPAVCARIQTFRCPRGQAPFSNDCGCGCGGAVLACRTDEHCVVPGASCLEGRCVYPEPCECPDVEAPVCGEDTATYRNECEARCARVDVVAEGECVALDGCPDPDELAVVYFRRSPLGCDFMSYFCEEEEEKVPPECGCGCFVPPVIPCLETNDCPVAAVCRGGICVDEPERCDFDFECGRDSFCYDLRCVQL